MIFGAPYNLGPEMIQLLDAAERPQIRRPRLPPPADDRGAGDRPDRAPLQDDRGEAREDAEVATGGRSRSTTRTTRTTFAGTFAREPAEPSAPVGGAARVGWRRSAHLPKGWPRLRAPGRGRREQE